MILVGAMFAGMTYISSGLLYKTTKNYLSRRKLVGNESESKRRKSLMIQGLRTVIYHVTDLAKAKTWYSEVLGAQPDSTSRFMLASPLADLNWGLVPDGKSGAGGTVAYWGVADAAEAVARLERRLRPSWKSCRMLAKEFAWRRSLIRSVTCWGSLRIPIFLRRTCGSRTWRAPCPQVQRSFLSGLVATSTKTCRRRAKRR